MGVLYVVATPIGNMGDISPRALDVLGQVSLIAAEDTRVTGLMLSRFNIRKPMISYHKFSEKDKSENIVERLKEDDFEVAIVTDAGTPCISDPGSVLVDIAHREGIPVVGIPGASAVTLALSVSGFDTTTFAFYGFYPRAKGEQEEFLERIFTDTAKCAVFYESPKRIKKTLKTLFDSGIEGRVCVCNDLTKKFERIYRGDISQVLDEIENNDKSELGEYAVVIEKADREKETTQLNASVSLEARVFDLYISGMSVKDAVSKLTKEGVSRNDAYTAGLNVKKYLQ